MKNQKSKLGIIIALLIIIQSNYLIAQTGVAINSDNSNAHSSAMLDVSSSSKGFLLPRMTQAQKNSISSPATSLLIYQTDIAQGYYYYNGSNWVMLASSGNNWGITGNSGTNPSNNFIGTTDNVDFVLRTNNIERFRIKSNGLASFNVTNPSFNLSFNGDTSKIIGLERSANSYAHGQNLMIIAGGAADGKIDGQGGNLILSSGLSTGGGFSLIKMNVYRFSGGSPPIPGLSSTPGDSFTRLVVGNVGIAIGDDILPTASITFEPEGSKTIRVERRTTSNTVGQALTVQAGGATSSATDKNGGNLILAGGIASGAGGSSILFQTAYSATSGNTTRTPTTKMTLTADGKLGIGTTSPDQLLSVNGNASKSGGGSWATFSDIRMKKDTTSFNDGLSVLKNIHPVKFKYNGVGGVTNTTTEYVGVIAQEIQQYVPYTVNNSEIEISGNQLSIFPDAVFLRNDSITSIVNGEEQIQIIPVYKATVLMYDSNALLYLLINAVKELDNKTNEINVLRNRIDLLEQQGNN